MRFQNTVYFLFVCFLLILSNSCIAQDQVEELQIDEIFRSWDKDNSPGVAVGIVKEGELIFAKGYGMANLDHNIPIERNSVFDIASVSKQFCGMAIAMLIKEDKLSEEDDIRKYLPDFPDYGKTITIGNLLHHTSGIRDWPTLLIAAGFQFDDVLSFDHIVNLIYKQKELSFETGTEYVYSNSNYSLLVRILEEVTGDQFDRWCRKNIFKPLGMNDTHFHIDHRRVVKNRVDSYSPAGGNLYLRIANNLCAVGSSSLYTTIEDLAIWIRNFKTGEVGGLEVIEMMIQPSQLENGDPVNYGFGIGFGKWKGREIWSHSGGWAGFRTTLIYLPNEDFGIIILSNNAVVAPGQLAQKVGDLYFPDDIDIEEVEDEINKEEEEVSDEEEEEENKKEDVVVEKFDPGVDELSEYTGIYYSEEVSANYKMILADEKLVIEHERSGQLKLNPYKKDIFFTVGMPGEIRFIRDGNGEISEFRLSMPPRTRNIQFVKF